MILSHPGTANAAEGQIVNEWLDRAVIDGSIAGCRGGQDLLRHDLILGEQVEAKRARPRVDEVDHLFDVADLQNREDRAEDLFLHYGRVWRHIRQNGRRDEAVTCVVLTAMI